MRSITDLEREHWENHGYVLIKRFFDSARAIELASWVQELASWPEAPGKWMKWYEIVDGARQLCRVEDFLPYHLALSELLQEGELAVVIEELMGEHAALYKEKVNFKLPGGAGFKPHQDAPAFTTFGQSYHVTLMLSVDPATLDNGCLEVVDGYHGAGLLPQAIDGTLDEAWAKRQVWKPIETEPGDILLFDSLVPHRSGPNVSGRPRRALYVTYNRESDGQYRAQYFARKRQAFPPECERAPGVDYGAGATVYNLGNPIAS